MRSILLLFVVFSLSAGAYLSWNRVPALRSRVEELLSGSTFQTLEVRYSPESIMEGNRVFSTALADARITYSQAGELKNNSEPGLITKLFNLFL
ncbi:MAG: flagellar basal body L-ring protein FlgH [Candidatus Margulisiibacteriota bacterium]